MNADTEGLDNTLSERVIGAFFAVYNTLGYGFLETVYENALAIALEEIGLVVERQVPFSVRFRGKVVGDYRVDLLVEKQLIVETKAVSRILPVHETQLVNYLKATTLQLGLLLNFGPKPEIRRKIMSSRQNLRSSAQSASKS